MCSCGKVRAWELAAAATAAAAGSRPLHGLPIALPLMPTLPRLSCPHRHALLPGRSDYFPAEGRTPGSGSKKGFTRGARPIPPRPPLGGGPGGSEAPASPGGGSYGASPGAGSYGSLSRRGSHFERYFAEREAAAAGFTGPGSLGPRGATPPSARGSGGAHTPGRASATAAGAGDHFVPILPQRVDGLKRVVHVAVGEKHSLAVQRWSAAQLAGLPNMPWLASDARGTHALAPDTAAALYTRATGGEESGLLTTPRSASGGDLSAEPSTAESSAPASPEPPFSPMRPRSRRQGPDGSCVGAPSLQRLAEEVVARHLVDPRTALQVCRPPARAAATC